MNKSLIVLTVNKFSGVCNFVPCSGPAFGKAVVPHKNLAGISFTGSSPTFNHLWKEVGKNIDNYKLVLSEIDYYNLVSCGSESELVDELVLGYILWEETRTISLKFSY